MELTEDMKPKNWFDKMKEETMANLDKLKI